MVGLLRSPALRVVAGGILVCCAASGLLLGAAVLIGGAIFASIGLVFEVLPRAAGASAGSTGDAGMARAGLGLILLALGNLALAGFQVVAASLLVRDRRRAVVLVCSGLTVASGIVTELTTFPISWSPAVVVAGAVVGFVALGMTPRPPSDSREVLAMSKANVRSRGA